MFVAEQTVARFKYTASSRHGMGNGDHGRIETEASPCSTMLAGCTNTTTALVL